MQHKQKEEPTGRNKNIAEIKITTSGLNKYICLEERQPFQGALKLSDSEY